MRPEITPHPPPATEVNASEMVHQLLEVHLPEIQKIMRGIVIQSRVCRPDEFSDLLNEVVKQVLEKAGSFDLNRPFVPWVLGFAGYVLAERKRQGVKAQKQVPISQLYPEADSAFWEGLTSSKKIQADENRRQLGEWLAELNDEDRRIIELRFFHKYDDQELAEAIGAKSLGAARVRLCRALKRLRHIALGEEGGAA